MTTKRRLNSQEMRAYTDTHAQTAHIQHRAERLSRYDTGAPLEAFEVDKGHPNGTEIHAVDSKGYIWIYNTRTHKHITTISARPGQIKRYYKDLRYFYSEEIARAIRIAYIRNEATGANYF